MSRREPEGSREEAARITELLKERGIRSQMYDYARRRVDLSYEDLIKLALARRVSRDEAIAIVKDAMARSSEPDIPGIRLVLEALAAAGVFSPGLRRYNPRWDEIEEVPMTDKLDAAGIR